MLGQVVRISYLARFGKYASWTVLDQAVMLGLTRLVLFPVLLWIFVQALDEQAGENLFGSFALAIGFVSLIGNSPSNGLSGYVLRDAVNHEADQQRVMLRTVLLLSIIITLPVALVYVVGGGPIGRAYDDTALTVLLPFMGVYLLLFNVAETMISIYRVRRTFGWMVLIHSIHFGLLFLTVPFYLFFGVAGLGYAYVLAGSAALLGVVFLERQTFLERPYYSRRFRIAALKVWLPFSAAAFIHLSSGYLDRLLLGYWWPGAELAAFVAAAATARILQLPGSQVSVLLVSLLGRIQTSGRFSRQFYALYAAGSLLTALVVLALGSLLGKFVLNCLYPSLLEEALPLWNWVVGAAAATNVYVACRPFVTKFLPPNYIPIMVGISVAGRLVPVVLLVPRGGSLGAAQAMLIGSVIAALIWFVVFLWSFVFSKTDLSSRIIVDEPTIDSTTTES